MAIEFKGAYVYQIHENRKIYKGTAAKQSSGLVIYDGLTISEVEQILARMKELQSLKIAFTVEQENMTEESIDTERMMLGIDAYPEITWTNCADEMPPSAMQVITDNEGYYNIITGKTLHDTASFREIEQKTMSHLYWTPYTPEKWEELNK